MNSKNGLNANFEFTLILQEVENLITGREIGFFCLDQQRPTCDGNSKLCEKSDTLKKNFIEQREEDWLMGWVGFTRWIPDDDSLYVAGIRIPSSVIESWQKWFEREGILTRVERKNGGRVLFINNEIGENQNGDDLLIVEEDKENPKS